MPLIRRILSIETSCDDTSVAIVEHDGRVIALVSANQDLVHRPFGGVVPEVASRSHTEILLPLVEAAFSKLNPSSSRAWQEIDGIAVTSEPGLIGSLMVGVVTAKALGMAKNLPFLGVNHIEGHLLAPLLKDEDYEPPPGFTFPYLGLAVSGGHTSLFDVRGLGQYVEIGSTVDDAAGEAFDKFAKMLQLGYPGGPRVDKAAIGGDPSRFSFPRAMMQDEENLQMSFSGLKTAASRTLSQLSEEEIQKSTADLCASFQEAVVDALLIKLDRAQKKTSARRVVITGGVSANSHLRERAQDWAKKRNVEILIPPLRYCTDNAAMIGYAGILRMNRGEHSAMDLAPSPQSTPSSGLLCLP